MTEDKLNYEEKENHNYISNDKYPIWNNQIRLSSRKRYVIRGNEEIHLRET